MSLKRQKIHERYIYGLHPLIEAIKSGKYIKKIFLQKNFSGSNYKILFHLIKEYRIPFKKVNIEQIHSLTKTNTQQGVVALISSINFYHIDDLLPKMRKNPLILVLDRITDVRNFGSIVRTSECVGVDAIIIPAKGSAAINADAIQTSSGALFNIPICKENNLLNTLKLLKTYGIRIIAATEKANSVLYTKNLTNPLAIILGNERDGISSSYLTLADEILKLPMLGKISSLNVSIVCGVFLYEILRQRFYVKA